MPLSLNGVFDFGFIFSCFMVCGGGGFIGVFLTSFWLVVSVSIVNNKSPVFTACPFLMFTLFTIPPTSDGISIDAFSDSNTIIISSFFIFSPLEIGISLIVADSIPSPRSGKNIFFIFFMLHG